MQQSVTLEAQQTDGVFNSWKTKINGDKASTVLYYMTNKFNLGKNVDDMVEVHRITFHDDQTTVARCPNPECFEAHINGKCVRGSLNVVCMALN